MPFGLNIKRSQLLYRVAQVFLLYSLTVLWCIVESCHTVGSIYMQYTALCSMASERDSMHAGSDEAYQSI